MSNPKTRLEDFRAGSREAYEEYYNLHYHNIYTFLWALSRNEVVTEDQCQEAFYILFKNREKIKNEEHLRAFLYTTARILFLQYLREQGMEAMMEAELTYTMDEDESYMGDMAIAEAEFLAENQKAFLRLTSRKRRIVVLFFFQGLNPREIAQRLRIKEQTVRNHLAQAIDQLRNDLCGGWDGKNNPLFA